MPIGEEGFVLTGCSGGGKSSLLAELKRRGCAVVEEPGLRIVADELATGGNSTPWDDPIAFVTRLVTLAREDLVRSAGLPHLIFFDRGLIDAAAAMARMADVPLAVTLEDQRPYHRRVFVVPPWPDIYRQDHNRRHTLADAVVEYDDLIRLYPLLGYELVVVPKLSVAARADFVLAMI